MPIAAGDPTVGTKKPRPNPSPVSSFLQTTADVFETPAAPTPVQTTTAAAPAPSSAPAPSLGPWPTTPVPGSRAEALLAYSQSGESPWAARVDRTEIEKVRDQGIDQYRAEQEASEDRKTRALTADAIGLKQGPVHQTPKRPQGIGVGDVVKMTPERYAALDPQQRAAVDFNTMLVQAVRKDLEMQDKYNPDGAEEQAYEAEVERIFGEGRGSDTYAPETVALLDQINLSNHTADLDDFLGLNAAITRRDIRQLPTAEVREVYELPPTDPGDIRIELSQQLANRTREMQEVLAQGQQLLATMNKTAALARNDSVLEFGGFANDPKLGLGYGLQQRTATGAPADLNTYFQDVFENLSRAEVKDPNEVLELAKKDLSDDEYSALAVYIENRVANAAEYGGSLGMAPGVQYRKPGRLDKLLGQGE